MLFISSIVRQIGWGNRFCTGQIQMIFHCLGKVDILIQRLMMWVSDDVLYSERNASNFAGMWSWPVEVSSHKKLLVISSRGVFQR